MWPWRMAADELDGLANVAKGLAAARFVEDGVDVRGQGRGLCREENLAAVGGGGDAGGEVDGAADVVAVALNGSSVVHADANGRRSVPAQDVMGDP